MESLHFKMYNYVYTHIHTVYASQYDTYVQGSVKAW